MEHIQINYYTKDQHYYSLQVEDMYGYKVLEEYDHLTPDEVEDVLKSMKKKYKDALVCEMMY